MCQYPREYVKRVGEKLVHDDERDKELVDLLLAFKDRLDTTVSTCFRGHPDLVLAQRDASEVFINSRKNKPAELIAKYIDEKLKNVKGSSEDELDQLFASFLVSF
jgi:cullin-4